MVLWITHDLCLHLYISGSELQTTRDCEINIPVTNKAQPGSKICKNPMKGHKNIKDCPKNSNLNE